MRWRDRDISGLAGIAAMVIVALLLLGLFWLACATFFLGKNHFGRRI